MLQIILSLFIASALLFISSQSLADDLKGTYTHVQDSDGTVPKKSARITITFTGGSSGSVSMHATRPGRVVSAKGTFTVSGTKISINFDDLDWQADNKPFRVNGCYLELPFKALGFTDGPGTSSWIKDGCSSIDISSPSSPVSGSSSGLDNTAVADNKPQADAEVSDQRPLSGLDSKESCAQCKYISCIKSLIAQKEAIVNALGNIASAKKWPPLDGTPLEGRDYIDEKGMSEEAAAAAGADLDSDRQSLLADMNRRISPEHINAVKNNCPFDGSIIIIMQTDSKFCNIEQQSIDSVISAIPCREIVQFMYYHESYHFTRCRERIKSGIVGLLTAQGEAREDFAAYSIELKMLKDLLARAANSTKGGCWRCGPTQIVYPDAVQCNDKCPSVRLKGPLMFKCWRLNENGDHYNIISPEYRF